MYFVKNLKKKKKKKKKIKIPKSSKKKKKFKWESVWTRGIGPLSHLKKKKSLN